MTQKAMQQDYSSRDAKGASRPGRVAPPFPSCSSHRGVWQGCQCCSPLPATPPAHTRRLGCACPPPGRAGPPWAGPAPSPRCPPSPRSCAGCSCAQRSPGTALQAAAAPREGQVVKGAGRGRGRSAKGQAGTAEALCGQPAVRLRRLAAFVGPDPQQIATAPKHRNHWCSPCVPQPSPLGTSCSISW